VVVVAVVVDWRAAWVVVVGWWTQDAECLALTEGMVVAKKGE